MGFWGGPESGSGCGTRIVSKLVIFRRGSGYETGHGTGTFGSGINFNHVSAPAHSSEYGYGFFYNQLLYCFYLCICIFTFLLVLIIVINISPDSTKFKQESVFYTDYFSISNRKFKHSVPFFRRVSGKVKVTNEHVKKRVDESLPIYVFRIGLFQLTLNDWQSLLCRMNHDWKWPEGFLPLSGSRSMVNLNELEADTRVDVLSRSESTAALVDMRPVLESGSSDETDQVKFVVPPKTCQLLGQGS